MTPSIWAIAAHNVTLTLGSDAAPVEILRGVDLHVAPGASVALLGPSGSGKSSLMAVLAGLERASGGDVRVAGLDFGAMSEDELARARRGRIGIVLQAFHLLPTMTALENVAVPLELAGHPGGLCHGEGGIDRRWVWGTDLNHYPTQLSGGEQQRVAIARATAPGPQILFADEPTGNLDGATGHAIIELFVRAARSDGGDVADHHARPRTGGPVRPCCHDARRAGGGGRALSARPNCAGRCCGASRGAIWRRAFVGCGCCSSACFSGCGDAGGDWQFDGGDHRRARAARAGDPWAATSNLGWRSAWRAMPKKPRSRAKGNCPKPCGCARRARARAAGLLAARSARTALLVVPLRARRRPSRSTGVLRGLDPPPAARAGRRAARPRARAGPLRARPRTLLRALRSRGAARALPRGARGAPARGRAGGVRPGRPPNRISTTISTSRSTTRPRATAIRACSTPGTGSPSMRGA